MASSTSQEPLGSCLTQTECYKVSLEDDYVACVADDFAWLTPMHFEVLEDFQDHFPTYEEPLSHTLEKLEKVIVESTKASTVKIPETFHRFFSDGELPLRVPSMSANYFGLYPDQLIICQPGFAGGNGGVLIRFWTDQQGCYYWYLYIDNDGRHCVLGSEDNVYSHESDEANKEDQIDNDGMEAPAAGETKSKVETKAEDDYGDPEDTNDLGFANNLDNGLSEHSHPGDIFMLPECAENDFEIWSPNFKDFIFLVWASNTSLYKEFLELPLTTKEKEYHTKYRHLWDSNIDIDQEGSPYLHDDGDDGDDTS